MNKLLLIGGSIVGIFVLTLLLVGGYYGLVPFFSTVMGATTPEDLGVTYTQQQAEDFNEKSKVAVTTIQSATPADSLQFKGSQEVDVTFTQEEISSRLQYDSWVYSLVENIQVRTNADGTVEVSGNIALSKIDEFLQASGYSINQQQVEQYLPYIEAIKVKPAIYIKGAPSVKDNVAKAGFIEARVANFTLTADQYDSGRLLDDWANTLLQSVEGADLDEVTFDENGAHVVGNLPKEVTVLTNGN